MNKYNISRVEEELRKSTAASLQQLESLKGHVEERLSEEEWRKKMRLFEIKTIDPIKTHFN